MESNLHYNHNLLEKKKVRILMVDDYPMTLWGYELSLKKYSENYEWEFEKANNCDEAINLIKKNKIPGFEIVFLDLNIPPSEIYNIKNGEQLGKEIQKSNPNIKIVVLTMLNNPLRIKNVLKNLNPNGFIIKSEITPEVLLLLVESMLDNRTFYSQQIKKLQPLKIINDEDISDLDLEILHYISLGEKMKNLPNYIPLSMASIERRKKKLKLILGVQNNSDRMLIEMAKKRGVI